MAWALAGLWLATGCFSVDRAWNEHHPLVDTDNPRQEPGSAALDTDPGVRTDTFVQVLDSTVDVLFVVGPWEEDLQPAAHLNHLLHFFTNEPGVDFRMGVTSSDGGGTFVMAGEQSFIDAATEAPLTVLGEMLIAPAPQASNSLDAIRAAVDAENTFFRADASLHAVVVADRIDEGTEEPEAFADWFNALRPGFYQGAVHAMVPEEAVRTATVVSLTGGELASQTWPPDASAARDFMSQVGMASSGYKTSFSLSQRPVVETLNVIVESPIEGYEGEFNVLVFDQAIVGNDGAVGDGDYVYVPEANAIRFLSFIPEVDARVVVTYAPLDEASR